MTQTTENRKYTHVCVWPNADTRKVVLINDDGELARVEWRDRHEYIPGQGSFINQEEHVPLDWLVPIYGWEGDEQ